MVCYAVFYGSVTVTCFSKNYTAISDKELYRHPDALLEKRPHKALGFIDCFSSANT